jgi:hypothetical protein
MPPATPITASLDVPDARPEIVHALLTDIAAWRLWSPHVASVRPDHGTVRAGQTVATRAFFSPAVTPMHVDWVRPGEGMGWHSRAAGHTLTYENRVEPLPGGGTRIAFSAQVDGPAAGLCGRSRRRSAGSGCAGGSPAWRAWRCSCSARRPRTTGRRAARSRR